MELSRGGRKTWGGVLAGTVGLWYNETQRNGEGTGMQVNFYEQVDDKRLRFAVIVARPV